MQGGKVIACGREGGVADAVAGELTLHALAVSAGEFTIGHPDVGVRSVNDTPVTGFAIAKDYFPDIWKLAFEGVGQVKRDGLMLSAQGSEWFSKIGIEKVREKKHKGASLYRIDEKIHSAIRVDEN